MYFLTPPPGKEIPFPGLELREEKGCGIRISQSFLIDGKLF